MVADASAVHPIAAEANLAVLREVFRTADKPTRQKLTPILPPADVEFLGIRMRVDPRDNYTEQRIWLDGYPPEMKSLTAAVELIEGKNAFILDIGANCGAYAIPLALAAGTDSRLIAFEPNPVMIGRLGHNIRLNDLGHIIRVESCALGAAAGEAMLNQAGWNYGQATLKPTKRKKNLGHIVPVRSLLDFTHEAAGHDVSLLKIDVEGAEELVLGPLFDQSDWLPDAVLIETLHARAWDMDVIGQLTACGYDAVMEAEGNTLFVKD